MSCRSILLIVFLVVACEAPSPSPSPSPAASASPSQTAVETLAPTETPQPTAVPPEPSSVDLITAAVQGGEIDEATGYLYRFYAAWGDARLPEGYRGLPSEDAALALTAQLAFDTFPAEDQARLRPFLVRPSHPESYWSADPASQPTDPGTASGGVRTAAFVSAAACEETLWARHDVAGIPVTIWGRCRIDVNGTPTLTIEPEMLRAAALLRLVYEPMVAVMGPPIPDRFKGQVQGPGEVPEGGDGRLDVYLTQAPNVAYPRDQDVTYSGAAAGFTWPHDQPPGTAAGYVTMDVARRPDAFDQEATLAHELFHVLEYAHNAFGMQVCPYPSTASTDTCNASVTYHWFTEASAQWAVHEFLPTHREYVYASFRAFRSSMHPLASTDDENEYWSFMWPLFMEQETLRGAGIIGDTWDALEGKSGWRAVQAAVDSQLRFETSFRDFAVRVWNEKLEPGDPIYPRFNHPNLDADFPTTRPDEDPDPSRFLRYEALELDRAERFDVDLPELWAGYYRLHLPPGGKRLTLNFAGLNPNSRLDADALVRLRDGTWEHRRLDPLVTEWCIEGSVDGINDMILVLSNHSQTPEEHIRGTWTAQAESAGCLVATDGLTYTLKTVTGTPGVGYYAAHLETLTLRVKLKSNDFTGPFVAEFLNDGSTFQATIDSETIIEGIGGCNTVSEASGGGGGAVPGGDGVVANLSHVFEPVPGGSIGPEGRWVLTVDASVTIDVTESTTSCIGSDSATTQRSIQLPACSGDEVIDSDPGRTFAFHCIISDPGYEWSVTGKVTIGG